MKASEYSNFSLRKRQTRWTSRFRWSCCYFTAEAFQVKSSKPEGEKMNRRKLSNPSEIASVVSSKRRSDGYFNALRPIDGA
ncbi:MAG: hypothetical protein ACTS6G_04220 [Candidatus Hodgkinia cicadicola]